MPSKMFFEGQLIPFVSFDLTTKNAVTDWGCLVGSNPITGLNFLVDRP